MSAFLNQRLTNGGWDALSTALGGGRLTFYKMQAGQGTIANDDVILGMTHLVAPICDIPITSYVIEGDGQITLFGNINSKDLDAGFTFKELGVFATIEAPTTRGGIPSGLNIDAIAQAPSQQANPVVPPPAEGTALMYSYCNSYAASDYIPGSGETTDVTNTIQVTIKIAEAENVSINILAGEQFAVVNIGPPSVGAGPWSYTEANVAYMKRLVAGAATLITEDANTITIGQKQLTSDLDLYVANGNPNISPHFSSIQNAMDYLGQYIIPTTVAARIHISPGTYTSANTVWINHPNSQSITIQGPQNNTLTGTSVSITGSAWTWNMTVAGLPNTAQFVVGHYAIISYCGGTSNASNALGCGIFSVLSKTATSVTLRVPNGKASFALPGTNSIEITPLSVIITCSVNNRYVMGLGAAGVGLLQYVAIVQTAGNPTLTMVGLSISGNATLTCVGVYGFWSEPLADGTNTVMGILVGPAAGIHCRRCATTLNQNGLVVSGGTMNLEKCASSYNRMRGIWTEGGHFSCVYGYSWTGGNGEHGIVISANGSFAVVASLPYPTIVTQCNDYWGIWLWAGGGLLFSTPVSCTLWAQNNGLTQSVKYDCVVQNFGVVSSSQCIVGSRIFNSPVGTINSTGGLIN